ncbi:MAG TPA: efflux RND transporter periplasmic adaptor subunit, partial [Campylobacterales bacterium]|nr:efflux RND transporter periplasmic adaptor subunit [Campylobacterales bacterium]
IVLALMAVTFLEATTVEQLFNVNTVKVTKDRIENSRTYNGYVNIADDKIYTIALTQDAYVKNLAAANIYDEVVKGEKLFDIYSPEVYKAQIELLSAQKISAGLAKQMETKLALYDVSKRNISMIKKQGKASKYLPFYSPYSGIVIEKNITEGSAVKKGMEVYKLADLSSVWVVAKAYEADREFIQKGSKVMVTFSGDDTTYESVVDFVYPIVDRVNRTIDFRITLENNSFKIQPNAYATIKKIQSSSTNLVLPSTAVITKGERHLVFVPGKYEGEYKSKQIQAKRISSTKYEIVSGLKEGDIVVNNSLFLIDSDIVINGEE